MEDKRKFRIGQPVLVNLNHRVKVDYELSKNRRVKRAEDWGIHTETNDLVLAIVTGAKLFQEGEYHAGNSAPTGYGSMYGDYEPAYLSFDKNVEVWGVRTGYRNKEIYFFEGDLKVTESQVMMDQVYKSDPYVCFPASNIPFFWSGWTKHYQDKMSKESKDWPRDSKGKWAKDPKCYANKK